MASRIIIEACIITICIICGYSDLKVGIIKNKVLWRLGLVVILVNQLRNCFFVDVFNLRSYYFNCIIACIIALILYALKIWAGGDCKLYIVFVFSLPYEFIDFEFLSGFILILILLIAISIGFISIVIASIYEGVKKKEFPNLQDVLSNTKKRFYRYLNYFFILILLQNLILFIPIRPVYRQYIFVISALTILIVIKIKYSPNAKMLIYIIMADLILGVVNENSLISLRSVLVCCIVIFVSLIQNYVNFYSYKSISIDEIMPLMILSTETSIILKELFKADFISISKESLGDRLNQTQVSRIKEIPGICERISEIVIVRKIPLGFFICVVVAFCIIGIELLWLLK